MKKLLTVTLTLLLLASSYFGLQAQSPGKLYAGFGVGLPYGGFGAQLSYYPVAVAGVFGGLGYNLDALGYNIGARFRFPTVKRLTFDLTGMYGYNAVLVVKGNVTSKTTYYGPSIGSGLILKSKTPERSYWSIELILPFRPAAYHDAINDLKQIGYDVKEPLPVAICFGFHIKIR